MGSMEWFLGMHFQLTSSMNKPSVHLLQTSFATHLVNAHNIHPSNIILDAAPYCSALTTEAILDSDKDLTSSTFVDLRHSYQSVIGLIG